MIDYGSFCFASPPRTATSWFKTVCLKADILHDGRGASFIPSNARGERLSVSLVRHPYDWLSSFYHAWGHGSLFRSHTGYVEKVDKFTCLANRTLTFTMFMDDYFSKMPGAVGEMFASYNSSTVMRLEDLPWAVVEFFQSLGFNGSALNDVAQTPPLNESKKSRPFSKKPPKWLRSAVCEAESEFCDLYDYRP